MENLTIQPARRHTDHKSPWIFVVLTVVFVLMGAAATAYHYTTGQFEEDTDNAYVAGDLVQISPQQAGTVQRLLVAENQYVTAGDVLVELDPADAQIQLAAAKADLARSVRDVRAIQFTGRGLAAQGGVRQAELARAKEDLARLRADYERRAKLVGTGAVATEEIARSRSALDAAQSQLVAAQSAVAVAQQQHDASSAQLDSNPLGEQPGVQRAKAALQAAVLALSRTTLKAPVSGYVAKRSVQVGSRVQPGYAVMTVVPLNSVWVEANYKEAQLKNVRLGQAVTLHADIYGKEVTYHGEVDSIGAGTGGVFALLPPQNATGNWIKVVQRVPVRIRLQMSALATHPLRVGLSMQASINTHSRSGLQLGTATPATPGPAAPENALAQADRLAADIIAANHGNAAP